jgi:hypothetical protein
MYLCVTGIDFASFHDFSIEYFHYLRDIMDADKAYLFPFYHRDELGMTQSIIIGMMVVDIHNHHPLYTTK